MKLFPRGMFLFLVFVALIPSLAAQPEPVDSSPLLGTALTEEEIPSTLLPVLEVVQPLIRKVSVIVGGIFGLYIILILVRIYYERKVLKTLQAICYNLDQWNMKQGVPSSRQKRGILKKMVSYLRSLFSSRKSSKPSGRSKS